ncbi:MAG TPA: GNAT family N-acetyltransferase, partial [Bacilli bacterium]|nr:GNAT family N-acetyltransferase [Bacilli bacterium]
MIIRHAQDRDRQWLIREYLEHMSPDLEQAARYALRCLQVDRVLLAEEERFPLGLLHWTARWGLRHGLAEIVWLRVISSRRRQGLGRLLLERALCDMQTCY